MLIQSTRTLELVEVPGATKAAARVLASRGIRQISSDTGRDCFTFQHLHFYQMAARIQELDDDQCNGGQ